MKEIVQIMMFRTTDGRLFSMYEDAEKHQKLTERVEEIVSLLGGYNRDIDSTSDFSNGKGYLILVEDDFRLAETRINKLKAELGLDEWSITSRGCYENDYLGVLSHIMSCVCKKDDRTIRVGQPYYAKNLNELGDKVYEKSKPII